MGKNAKGGIFNDPAYILNLKWDKIKIYESKKTKDMVYDIKSFTSDLKKDYSFNYRFYSEVLENSGNKVFAFIATVLLQKGVNSIKLKGHEIKLGFNDGTSVNIDVLNYELDNYVADIINLAVSNYRKCCMQEVRNYLKSNKITRINFNKSSSYESNYKKDDLMLNFTIMRRGDKIFGLNENDFAISVVKEFLDNEEDEVLINKRLISFDDSNSVIVNPTVVGIVLSGRKTSISIMNNIDYLTVSKLVKEHNEKVKGKTYVMKRGLKNERFNNGKNS